MRALGTIVEMPVGGPGETEIYSGVLDYWDHWESVDHRLKEHHTSLSKHAEAFGHDLVNMATYAHEILSYLDPITIRRSESVVVASTMTEGFLVSVRTACDAVAAIAAYAANPKRDQVPGGSLRKLLQWMLKHPEMIHPEIRLVLSEPMDWFWNIRALRDHIVHAGAHPTIHCDGRQFNVWIYSPARGWVTREPLLPLLKSALLALLGFGDSVANAANAILNFPEDRVRSRVVSGVLVPALHKLVLVAEQYATPSP